jgi:hypothetical protein
MPAVAPAPAGLVQAKAASSVGAWLLAGTVLAVLAYAWANRLEGDLTPKTGTGYLLGIVGATMMLSLLLYPLRKSWKLLSRAGSVRLWFTAHMILGVIGPALIVLHSNFSLRSTNATVAMSLLLAVVASGILGRYVYARLGAGVNGQRVSLTGLLADAQHLRAAFGAEMEHAPAIEAAITAYEDEAQALRQMRFGSIRAWLYLGSRTRACRRFVIAEAEAILEAHALRARWTPKTLEEHLAAANAHFDAYFATIQRAASLHFFERLFRFWHVFHLPLFLLLILAAIGHVIAVHMY